MISACDAEEGNSINSQSSTTNTSSSSSTIDVTKYTVTFDTNGGTSIDSIYDNYIAVIPTTEKEGYDFFRLV